MHRTENRSPTGKVASRHLRQVLILITAATFGAVFSTGSHAAPGATPIQMELNKLEAGQNACRVYMVFENGSAHAFKSLKTDLVVFGNDGIIAKRLAVEGGPLSAKKTIVKLFDIGGVKCDGIGRVLLNGVMACEDESGVRDDCTAAIQVKSRADVPFVK